MSASMTYRIGNIIGYVVSNLVAAWTTLLRRVGTEALSTYLLPYLWYNTKTGMFEHLTARDGLAPTSQQESFVLEIRPIHSGGAGVDQTAAARYAEHDHAMRHAAYVFLRKLKNIISKNATYQDDGNEIINYLPIRALRRKHADKVPFVFAEMEDAVMATLKIHKPVLHPL